MHPDDEIVLEAYALSPAPVTVYDLISNLTSLRDGRDLSDIPLNSRRERATTRLRKAGLIVRSQSGWAVTDTGRAEIERIQNDCLQEQVGDLESFLCGNH